MATVKVKMLSDGVHKDRSPLKAGKTYDLPEDSAAHWIKRGKAERVGKDAPRADEANAPGDENDVSEKPSEDMTIAELKDALDAMQVDHAGVTLKDDFVALHKKAVKAAAKAAGK